MVSRPIGGVLSTESFQIQLCDHPSMRSTWECRRTSRPLPSWPCSEWGLPSRTSHLIRWCALTAPFHPCLFSKSNHRRFIFCGTFLQVTLTGR